MNITDNAYSDMLAEIGQLYDTLPTTYVASAPLL